MRGASWLYGATITATSGRIRRSATARQFKRAGRLRWMAKHINDIYRAFFQRVRLLDAGAWGGADNQEN